MHVEVCSEYRTMEENMEFLTALKDAVSNVIKAKESISEENLPYINVTTCLALNNVINELEQLGCAVAEGRLKLIKSKSVKKPETVYCYELLYFYNRAHCGVMHLETTENKEDYVNDDAFLETLVFQGVLSSNTANAISGITLLRSYSKEV